MIKWKVFTVKKNVKWFAIQWQIHEVLLIL